MKTEAKTHFIISEWKRHFYFNIFPVVELCRTKYYRYTEFSIMFAWLIFAYEIEIKIYNGKD